MGKKRAGGGSPPARSSDARMTLLVDCTRHQRQPRHSRRSRFANRGPLRPPSPPCLLYVRRPERCPRAQYSGPGATRSAGYHHPARRRTTAETSGRGISAAGTFPSGVSAGAGALLLRVPQQPQDVFRSLVGLAKHGHGRLGNHLVPGKLAEFRGHVGVANHRFGRGQFLPRNGEAAEL